jgi:hypothetical protein
LVVEPINGRDKVVEELMGGKAVGEMDSREEDKGEGRTRGGGSFVLGDILVYGKVRKFGEEEGGRGVTTVLVATTVFLEDSHRGTIVAGNFGLGGQETVRIPGAREPERLFLVGWEVNTQFWAGSASSTTLSDSGSALSASGSASG